jgi:3',5'-cyclic AMP phosphodiesterase CpdA
VTARRTTETLSRRRFLAASGAGVAAAAIARLAPAAEPAPGGCSFGLVTDVHYADIPTKGSRYYRDSRTKLQEAVERLNDRKVDFVIELGDFCDAGPTKEAEIGYLRTIRGVFEGFRGPRHYVLGNHCVAALTKAEFLEHCGATVKRSYYSFDHGPWHFVVLDADFRRDETPYGPGNFEWTDSWIPAAERQWLADDLTKAGGRKTIVFAHQNLHNETDAHGVKNAPEVRRILESAGNVVAVFQGHMHSGGHARLGGIDYCTLRAMVEGPGAANNAYAIVSLNDAGIKFEGFGQQNTWPL